MLGDESARLAGKAVTRFLLAGELHTHALSAFSIAELRELHEVREVPALPARLSPQPPASAKILERCPHPPSLSQVCRVL